MLELYVRVPSPRCGLERTKLIAKLDTLEGMFAHAELAELADGVMLARGHLGTLMDPEKVRGGSS